MVRSMMLGAAATVLLGLAGTAGAETGTKTVPVPASAAAPAPFLEPAPLPKDFLVQDSSTVAAMSDIPSSGSSSQYIHGPNEGPVPGAGSYALGGPPPNAQPSLGGW